MRTGNLECSKVTQILSVNSTPTKNIDHIIHECRCVTLPWRRNKSNTLEFGPFTRCEVERPGVVVVIRAVGSSKAGQASAWEWLEWENTQHT